MVVTNMHKFTEDQLILMKVLASKRMDPDNASAVAGILQKYGLEREMLNYLEKNQQATIQEILNYTEVLRKIGRGTNC